MSKGKEFEKQVGRLFEINKLPSNYEFNLTKSSPKDSKILTFSMEFKNNELEIPLNISRMGRAL